MWTDAVKFFNAKKKRVETIRGDFGGHFPESAAEWSINQLHKETTGAFEIHYGDRTADAKLPFATELVASVILKADTVLRFTCSYTHRCSAMCADAIEHLPFRSS
jgi:hypothetical protein